MRAGKLRHRVTIQRATETQSDSGEVSRTWSTLATVWADIKPTSGAEAFRSGKIRADVGFLVTIRGGVAAAPSDRISLSGRTLEIVSVADEDERGVTLTLGCNEVVE